jgi:hypothetical protein
MEWTESILIANADISTIQQQQLNYCCMATE